MKTTKRLLLNYCIFPSFMLFTVFPAQSETIIDSATVSGTWTVAASPYLITNTIEIPPDSTLTIEPGVTVEFQGHYALQVKGRLLAIGTESDTILFTINDTTGFSDRETTLGGWNGIRFIDTPAQNDSSKIIFCRLQYGKAVGNVWHINAGGAVCVIDFDKLLISNCLITHNSCGGLETEVPSGGAIHLHKSDIRLVENTISYNRALDGGAIHAHDSDPVYIRNIISHNQARQAGGISVAGSALTTFSHDKFIANRAVIEGGGLIVWDSTFVSLNNVTILGNQAQYAAGISLHGGELHVNGGEIAQNKAAEWGGGIGTWSGELYIDGCTISHNAVPIWGGGIASN